MSNYESTTRTNYFKVKSIPKFKQWAELIGQEVIEDKKGVGLICQDGIPDFYIKDDEEHEIDFMKELSYHLKKGEIAIVMSAGAEKARYVSGFAFAVNHEGKQTEVYLEDIYYKASKAFKTPIDKISRAEY